MGNVLSHINGLQLGLIRTQSSIYLKGSIYSYVNFQNRLISRDSRFSLDLWTHHYAHPSFVTHLAARAGKKQKTRARLREAPPTETETGISWRKRPDLTVTRVSLVRSVSGSLLHKHWHSHTCSTWDSFWPRCWLCSATEVSLSSVCLILYFGHWVPVYAILKP